MKTSHTKEFLSTSISTSLRQKSVQFLFFLFSYISNNNSKMYPPSSQDPQLLPNKTEEEGRNLVQKKLFRGKRKPVENIPGKFNPVI